MHPPGSPSAPTRRRFKHAAAVAALLLTAQAGVSLTGQAVAAPPHDDRPAERAASQPSASEILQGDMEWAARHAVGSKAWAVLEAKRTGKKVTAFGETTADSLTVANPDGSLTTELTAGPERVWRDGEWRTFDATLVTTADGSVQAKEHPHGLKLAGTEEATPGRLNAGKEATARDLVTLGTRDRSVTLQWKGALPNPQLDGDTARYPEAVPGADVVVKATRTGFEQFIEIHQRPTGAYAYTLPLKAEGMQAKAEQDGSVTFTDATTGEKRATMPAPVMWDASVDALSGKHTRQTRVDMKVVDRGTGLVDLVVTPDANFLNDPNTRYPVTVDPSTSALSATFDTYVQHGETVDWSNESNSTWATPAPPTPTGRPASPGRSSRSTPPRSRTR
ncbi:hypothetical protein ACFRCG_07640 [Embleya sp. NPDC056575]|uniref:hypothetical protein n=1 Tax=unclassified Embleya TaxID=2699296 RepID=UPI00368CE505